MADAGKTGEYVEFAHLPFPEGEMELALERVHALGYRLRDPFYWSNMIEHMTKYAGAFTFGMVNNQPVIDYQMRAILRLGYTRSPALDWDDFDLERTRDLLELLYNLS